MGAGHSQVLRTKGPIGDMLPANSPPTNGKASHKRKAPAETDSPADAAAGQSSIDAEPASPAVAQTEEHAPAKKQTAAKRQGVVKKAPVKRGKVSESGQAPPQTLVPPGNASQAATDGLPATGSSPVVLPATDAGPAGADDGTLAMPNGHVLDAAEPGPGEGVPPVGAALLCKKKGGWPKGKPRRNHVPTGKVRRNNHRPSQWTLMFHHSFCLLGVFTFNVDFDFRMSLSRIECFTSSYCPISHRQIHQHRAKHPLPHSFGGLAISC